MKLSAIKIMLFGLFAALMCCAEIAVAQVATVSELTGTVQATAPATAGGATRTLRKGDTINQGDTLITGDASSVVVVFTDKQVAALAARSRLVISSYIYAPMEPAKSNVLFSLLQGGMRSITGLIGRARPQAVSYRAGSATIGIRGTDVNIAVDGGVVGVSVSEGQIAFTFEGTTVSIPSGQGAVTVGGMIKSMPAAQVIAALKAQGASPALIAALTGLAAPDLEAAVIKAVTPTPPPPGTEPGRTPEPGTNANAAGGGSASKQ